MLPPHLEEIPSPHKTYRTGQGERESWGTTVTKLNDLTCVYRYVTMTVDVLYDHNAPTKHGEGEQPCKMLHALLPWSPLPQPHTLLLPRHLAGPTPGPLHSLSPFLEYSIPYLSQGPEASILVIQEAVQTCPPCPPQLEWTPGRLQSQRSHTLHTSI